MAEEISELKDTVDAASAYEDIVEDLTAKNLELAEEKQELKLSIQELEELRDLSEEMEVQQAELVSQLQTDIVSKDQLVASLNLKLQQTAKAAKLLEKDLAKMKTVAILRNDETAELRKDLEEATNSSRSRTDGETLPRAAMDAAQKLRDTLAELRAAQSKVHVGLAHLEAEKA